MRNARRSIIVLATGLFLAIPAIATNDKPIDVAYYKGGHFYTDGKGIDKNVVDELKKCGCEFGKSLRTANWP